MASSSHAAASGDREHDANAEVPALDDDRRIRQPPVTHRQSITCLVIGRSSSSSTAQQLTSKPGAPPPPTLLMPKRPVAARASFNSHVGAGVVGATTFSLARSRRWAGRFPPLLGARRCDGDPRCDRARRCGRRASHAQTQVRGGHRQAQGCDPKVQVRAPARECANERIARRTHTRASEHPPRIAHAQRLTRAHAQLHAGEASPSASTAARIRRSSCTF